IAKSILLAGKDVFVEKPLALNSSQGRELVMLAKEQNCILMVGHILHYHSAIIKLKQMITIGQLGQIQYVYSNRLNIGKLSIGENILWSFASHDISILLSLLEEPLINVSAFGEDIINKGIYDTALVNLEFKSGIKGHIFVNWLHPFKEQKLVIVGSIGMAVFDDVSMEKLYFYPHKIETKIGTVPVVHKADYQIIQVDCNESLKEELKHFIDCIINRKKPITDGKEGLKVLEVLEIAENSLKDYKSNKNIKIQKVYYPYNNSHISNNIIFAKDTVI
ncbi:MAG: Gfo/Idh/MocA family oxidoreductase, partial [Spirochaetota bacterium]|nr:Gfo/Idh/MocA family oxidoreductase [Spirochaetota bacterium]